MICLLKRKPWQFSNQCKRYFVDYVQGQYFKNRIREYFYYIDHQGQLFLDDAKVRLNNTGRYETDFPFISPCGREKNFIRCDDLPIVFTQLITKSSDLNDENETYLLSCNNTGDKLTVPFSPEKLCMLPDSLRVYHPASERVGGIGLVKSKLAIELSQYFGYDKVEEDGDFLPPTTFTWNGVTYKLTNELLKKAAANRTA